MFRNRLICAALALGITASAAACSASASSTEVSSTTSSNAGPQVRSVLYKASSTSMRADVIYQGDSDTETLANQSLPLSTKTMSGSLVGVRVELSTGDTAFISVTPEPHSGSASCSIEIGGKEVSSNTMARDASGEVLCSITVS